MIRSHFQPEDFLQSDLQSTALVLPKNNVPVIFVLGKTIIFVTITTFTLPNCQGGPGSGKITHCGRMVGQLNGWHHVNMGEVRRDFSSTRTVLQVMMGMLRNSVDTSTLSTPQVPNSHHCFFYEIKKIFTLYTIKRWKGNWRTFNLDGKEKRCRRLPCLRFR